MTVKDSLRRLELMQSVLDEVAALKNQVTLLEAKVQLCECECQRHLHTGDSWPLSNGACLSCPRGCKQFRAMTYTASAAAKR